MYLDDPDYSTLTIQQKLLKLWHIRIIETYESNRNVWEYLLHTLRMEPNQFQKETLQKKVLLEYGRYFMVEKIITCENQKAIAIPKSYLGKILFPELSFLS